MFFTRVKFFVTFLIIITLATFGSQKTGYANELEIKQEEVFSSDFLPYYRSFAVTSTIEPAYYNREASLLVPKMFWPTDIRDVSSGYGGRQSCLKCSTFHEGADFTPGEGFPVYSSLDGIVSEVGIAGEYGVYVVIDHIVVINTKTERWQTVYAHLQENSVPQDVFVGSLIKAGSIVGAVGRTGLTTGPHLHFEIRIDNKKVDPVKYLKMYAN